MVGKAVAKAVGKAVPKSAPKPIWRAISNSAVRGLDLKLGNGRSYVALYYSEPLQRVQAIKEGLSPGFLDDLSRNMGMPKERLLPTLGIARATFSRKARDAKALSREESERALGMARLVGQVEAMVQESGDPTGFNAAEWVAQWLEEPMAALGGKQPAEFMDTAEGQAIVSNLVARMQSGAYA